MATLREFIRDQSSLPAGNTIRDHIENPLEGGGGGLLSIMEIEVEMADDCITATIDDDFLTAELEDSDFEGILDDEELEAEVCE